MSAESNGAEEADLLVTTPAEPEEMLEDAAAIAAFHRTRDQERVPIELVDRLLAGESPVKVWREHRGLSQRALAARTGLNFAYLSQIETGARKGTTATLKRLAETLGVDLDDLT
jgi:ribosome-binding protein aMBF1 (putative translation factor)